LGYVLHKFGIVRGPVFVGMGLKFCFLSNGPGKFVESLLILHY